MYMVWYRVYIYILYMSIYTIFKKKIYLPLPSQCSKGPQSLMAVATPLTSHVTVEQMFGYLTVVFVL